jgi:hypothetical protein
MSSPGTRSPAVDPAGAGRMLQLLTDARGRIIAAAIATPPPAAGAAAAAATAISDDQVDSRIAAGPGQRLATVVLPEALVAGDGGPDVARLMTRYRVKHGRSGATVVAMSASRSTPKPARKDAKKPARKVARKPAKKPSKQVAK